MIRTFTASALSALAYVSVSNAALAAPDWQSSFNQLQGCLAQQDTACVMQVAEMIAFDLEPGKAVDYAKELPSITLSSERAGLLTNLIAYNGLMPNGDLKKGDRLYAALKREMAASSKKTLTRPLRSARQFMVIGHLRAGNAQQLAAYLSETTNYKGEPGSLGDKVSAATKAIRSLRDIRAEFDDAAAGKALASFLRQEEEQSRGNFVTRLFEDEKPINVIALVARLAGNLATDGYGDAAIELSKAFPDKKVSDRAAKATLKRDQKAKAQSDAIELIAANKSDQVISTIVAEQQSRFTGTSEEILGGSLMHVSYEISSIARKLYKQQRVELITSLLEASTRYADGLQDPVCRVLFLSRLMPFTVVTDDPALFDTIVNRLPIRNGTFNIDEKAKCGKMPIIQPYAYPQVVQAFAGGIDAVSAIEPSKDFGNMDTEVFMSGLHILLETGPLVDEDVVAAFFKRAALLEAKATNRHVSLSAARMAGLALKWGYNRAAFELAELALQGDPGLQAKDKSYNVSRVANAVLVSQNATLENRVKATVGALTAWRHLKPSLVAKGRVR